MTNDKNLESENIKEVDGNKVSIDDLDTDKSESKVEIKGLKKIREDDKPLVKEAKAHYNNELKFQMSKSELLRNKFRLDLYKGLIYLASLKGSTEAYNKFSVKILGYGDPNEHQIKGIKDRHDFIQMKEVKAFIAFLTECSKVYAKNKSWSMITLIQVLKENIFFHPYCQGSFRSARFMEGQERTEKKKEKEFSADDDIPF